MGKLYSFISALLIAVGSLYAVEPSGYEWWLDNDVSNVTSGSFPAGKLDLQIDTSDLPRGTHYFNCRLNTAEGKWGAVYRRMFYSIGKDQGAVSYEYWFDNDYDAKETGPLIGGKKTFAVDISSLTPGVHYFNCRLNAGEGEWGAVYRKMIYTAGASQDVSAYEYWFDNDYNNKVGGSITGGISSFSVDVNSISAGVHYFNCRLCTTDGKWGAIYRKMVLTTPTGMDATAYEYWIDDNYESKSEGNIVEGSNIYNVELSGLRRGLHRFNYRIRTGTGTWGSVYSKYFYLDPSSSFAKTYEYWLDDDYNGRQTMTSQGNTVSFNIDLSGFDKTSTKPHFLNLRVFDEGCPESSSFYRKLFVPFKGVKAPIIGYHHYANGVDLGYVSVERQMVDSRLFEVNLPDSMRFKVKGKTPVFDGDKISLAGKDSITYTMHVQTELGWCVPSQWNIDVTNPFSTTAVEMQMNSSHSFAIPKFGEFVAVKFTTTSDSIYFRTDLPISLDLYRNGDKVCEVSAEELSGLSMLKLEEGEYICLLRDAENSGEEKFTFHIMDTPNQTPAPLISFEDGVVTMTCRRDDAEIRYTIDGTEPTNESILYDEAFALTRNAVIKAIAFVPDSDIEPSVVAEFTVDSYKVATPTGTFDVASRSVTITCDTKDASIVYTFDREGEWLPYTGPISITRNCIVYVKATNEGYNDSEVAVISVTELADNVSPPVIKFEDGMVIITCATNDSEIRYTVDGSDPTADSQLYEAPFQLDRNATVKAFAYIPGLSIAPSDVVTLEIASYKTATPTGIFDIARRQLTINCATEGAALYYTFDREGEWLPYAGPISITRNCIVYAKATNEGYNDSEVAEIAVTELADNVAPPVIKFEDGMVIITCATDDSEIRYTVDGSDPTADSQLYEAPFQLGRNATVKAFAYIPGLSIAPSDVVALEIDSYKTAIPTGIFDITRRKLTINCATDGATLYYTFDREEEWLTYTGPISITRNCVVYAKATYEGYNDSEVAVISVTELADNVAPPVIKFEDGMVIITCATDDSEIRYTVDGSDPTADSQLYEAPFQLGRNATVKAFAYIPGLSIAPSDVVTLVIDSYKTATPTGIFDIARRQLTINCATEGVALYYTFDRAGEWLPYAGPISITRNCIVYAKATNEGYNDSEVAVISVTELADNVAPPVIKFEDGMVIITCATDDSEIRYTVDGSNPTADSQLYEAPFQLDRNATVKAFAYIPGLDIGYSDISVLNVTYYKTSTPYGEFDNESRLLTIKCDTEGASIFYTFDPAGIWTEYDAPIEVDGNGIVYARATYPDFNDSEVAEIVISSVKCSGVSINYNGRYVSLYTAEPDAAIRYTTDGSDPSNGLEYTVEFDVKDLCLIRAIAVKANYMNSDMAEYSVEHYADEEHAVTSSEGLLESCFGWDNTDLPSKVANYSFEGKLNDADYQFIGKMTALRHLDIEKIIDARIPEYAFRNSKLVSVSLPADLTEYGDSIFSGATNLSSVVWNSKSKNLERWFTGSLANPNVLLYVPAGISVADAGGLNVVTDGNADSVILRYGFPYYALKELHVDNISFTRDFRQATEIGVCQGWETLVIPFKPESITHETHGAAVPFAAWDGNTEVLKPFWLFGSSDLADGWVAAPEIEACTPYIISMPNNPNYVSSSNLAGLVTFSASDIDLGDESNVALTTPWLEGTYFEGTFLPVDEPGLLSLNVNDTEGEFLPGSTFVPDATTVPFGAYVKGAAKRTPMPLFGYGNRVELPTVIAEGILFETPAPGVIRITSGRDLHTTIVTPEGGIVRTLSLKAGESVTVEGLTRGLYICGGVKVMVK